MSDRFSDWINAWNNQNNLFWGRLQTAALIVSGAFTAYYNLNDERNRIAVMWLSITLTILLFGILIKDICHLNKIQRRIALLEPDFGAPPTTFVRFISSGRFFACLMMIALIVSQALVIGGVFSLNPPNNPANVNPEKHSEKTQKEKEAPTIVSPAKIQEAETNGADK